MYEWFTEKTIVGIGMGTQVNVEHTGWFSTGDNPGTRELIHDPRVGTPFIPAPVTDAQRIAIEKNLAAHGLDPAKFDLNAQAAHASGLARAATEFPDMTDEQRAAWYQHEHDSAVAYCDHGQTPYVCFAEVAATTSKAQWSMQTGASSVYGEVITVYPNLTAAATVAAFGVENPTVTLSQQDCNKINGVVESTFNPDIKSQTAIDVTNFANQPNPDGFIRVLTPGDYQMNQLSDYQGGKFLDMSQNALLPGVPIGLPDGLARGLAIARGADPADVLNGEKQLSFTTNGAFPQLNTATTNDTHIGAEMLAGATYPEGDKGGRGGQVMSAPDLAAYVQSFYNQQGGSGYRYVTEHIMNLASKETPAEPGHQYQAIMWVGDPTIAIASMSAQGIKKMYTAGLVKASKLDVQYPYRPYEPDDADVQRLDTADVLQAPPPELAKKCIVTAKDYAHPPWPKDQRHAARPKWLKDRIARGDFKGKGFGDPGSTQAREPNGTFGTGNGANDKTPSNLEDKAIAHFGAAEELQGQQFITPNGTILNLEGDSHDRIKEVMGGNVNTAESRAINAGFLRTSLDTVRGGNLGLVMEFSVPITDAQRATVMQGVHDAGGIGYVAIDVPSAGVHNVTEQDSPHNIAFSDEAYDPTARDISVMITAGNAATTGKTTKGFGDPGSTQEREPGGTFGPGEGMSPERQTAAQATIDAFQNDPARQAAAQERLHAPRLRDIVIGSQADTGELAMRSTPITAPHVTDPLAAQYAADMQFTTASRGTHEGDSLTEGFDLPKWFKSFGDPGDTQSRGAHGEFGVASATNANSDMHEMRLALAKSSLHVNVGISTSLTAGHTAPGHTSMSSHAAADASGALVAGMKRRLQRAEVPGTPAKFSYSIQLVRIDANGIPDHMGAYLHWVVVSNNPNIKPVDQYTAGGKFPTMDCGEASVASVLGGRATVSQIEHESGGNITGTFASQLVQALGENGVIAHAASGTAPSGYVMNPMFDAATSRSSPSDFGAYSAASEGEYVTVDTPKGFGDAGSTQTQDAHGRFTVGSGAPRDAANLKYPELHASDMGAGGTNSPLMTRVEFQASAARGEDIVNNAIANASPPVNITDVQAVVAASGNEWGGVTIDAHGGGVVSQTGLSDPLSVSMRSTGQGSVVIPITSDPGALSAAMQQAQTQFADQLSAQGAALGMFRDEKAGTVQFDPVLVVQGVATARDVGAYTGATGGAYRFSDGNGYWPGHVA